MTTSLTTLACQCLAKAEISQGLLLLNDLLLDLLQVQVGGLDLLGGGLKHLRRGKAGSVAGRISVARTWATHIPAAGRCFWNCGFVAQSQLMHPKRSLNSSVIRRHVGF